MDRIKKIIFSIILSSVLLILFYQTSSAEGASVNFDSTSYAYNSFPARIIVIDPAADLTSTPDTVSITVTTDSDPVGITLTLLETGDQTGEFRNTWLAFMDGDNLFPEGSTIDAHYDDENYAGSGTIEIFVSSIFPPNFGIDNRGIIDPFIITESTPSSFQGQFTLTSTEPTTETELQAVAGDFVVVPAPCDISIGFVIPNPDPTVGAIKALDEDTATVTYQDADGTISEDTATVDDGSGGCGGSGGGLIINRIVLDVLAGGTSGGDFIPPQLTFPKLNLSSLPLVGDILDLISNADPFTPIIPLDEPSIDYPLSINGNGYLLTQYANTIETYQGETGEPISFKMILFDSTGVEHIGLYTNLRGDHREISDSDTYLVYHEGKELEVTDPNGFFSNVNFTESEYDGKYIAEFDITFAKPMDTSDVIIRTWDELRNSGDIKVFDAIKIEGEPLVNPDTSNLIVPDSADFVIPYYKLPHYEIPDADSEGNLVYYNSFGGLEEKQVHPHHDPIFYPEEIGKSERTDFGFGNDIERQKLVSLKTAKSLYGEGLYYTYEFDVVNSMYSYKNRMDDLMLEKMKRENQRATESFNELFLRHQIYD